ncbi:DUF2786 domain-containing protein [Lentzea flava]|uniref:DUF2786 domain-containing protein n=1 Tax=Lentzea flava TaxID=103732 RepID=A0ABQ2UG98_9PSEU|nr:DUF2786 domain-containing protein [Lentzea flava]MCP2198556.1 Protein of unknown function (DUF2786) [Lentzea flava]GGU26686.1 hypothetical protein GCM10010178_18860 [Lentzea flava]
MGKRNREKRAAKKKVRANRGPTPPRYDFDGYEEPWAPPPVVSPEMVAEGLKQAAFARASDTDFVDRTIADLAGRRPVANPRTVAIGAGIVLDAVIDLVWAKGWTPVDVREHVRRTADAAAGSLLVDVIAADTAKHSPSTVDERWAAQVRGAEVWWESGVPQLLQWADRHGADLEFALRTTIVVIDELMRLPELPVIIPAPGSGSARSAASVSGVDQKVLTRVRGLLAKAESTQFPEEAEALSAKAQELMNRHAFERAVLDADERRKQTAASTRLWLDAPYVDAKAHLVHQIAKANRCRSVFYSRFGFVALVGESMDLEITELLVTSLQVQATRAMVAEGSQVTRAGTSRTRSFRQSFLISYAARIGERLEEAGARAHDPVEDERLLPVLAERSQVVEETFEKMFSNLAQKSVTVTDGAGWEAGRVAADRADISIDRRAVGV